jgi:hypothetical protein
MNLKKRIETAKKENATVIDKIVTDLLQDHIDPNLVGEIVSIALWKYLRIVKKKQAYRFAPIIETELADIRNICSVLDGDYAISNVEAEEEYYVTA